MLDYPPTNSLSRIQWSNLLLVSSLTWLPRNTVKASLERLVVTCFVNFWLEISIFRRRGVFDLKSRQRM